MGIGAIFAPVIGAIAGEIIGGKSRERQANAAVEAAKQPQVSEEVKRLAPPEQQAVGYGSYEGAMNWRQVYEAARGETMAGGLNFGSGAIQGGQSALNNANALQGVASGNNGRDAEYASYEVMKQSRDAVLEQIRVLGIDDGSGRNPYGVKITYDEYMELKRMKDPSQHIKNGTSIGDDVTPEEALRAAQRINPAAKDANPVWGSRYQFLEMMAEDIGLGGEALKAMQADPKHADAIAYWQSQGVIDTQFNVNQGQLIKNTEKYLTAVVEDRSLEPVTPEKDAQFRTEYDTATNVVVDPKQVRRTNLGGGVTRTTVYNMDGTGAAEFLEGSVTLPNGQTIDDAVIIGNNRKDWIRYQDRFDSTGTLFSDGINGAGQGSGDDGGEAEAPSSGGGSSGAGKAAPKSEVPPGYKGAPLNSGGTAAPPKTAQGQMAPMSGPQGVDPRTIPGYDPGLSYMGGFPGGVPPIQAENQARQGQGMPTVGGPSPEAMFQQMMASPEGQKMMQNFFSQMMSQQGGR